MARGRLAAKHLIGRLGQFRGDQGVAVADLNDNRELGLIISSHAVMSAIAGTFASDFRPGQHWS